MSSLNWTTNIAQTSNLMVIGSTDPNYLTMLPGMIDYAEGRIYRELDPLFAQVTDATAVCSSGNRNLTPPVDIGTYITFDSISIITPVGATSANGTRVPLIPISPEAMDNFYPSGQTAVNVPTFYAVRSPTNILLGPAPDAPYATEFVGIQRPASLSSANSSTFLTQYCPDLFIAAEMVFAFGFMRDFGGMADNPQTAQSWETQYGKLFQSAAMEQARAKWQSDGWTSEPPQPAGKRN